jgi:hypothetical protein
LDISLRDVESISDGKTVNSELYRGGKNLDAFLIKANIHGTGSTISRNQHVRLGR